VIVEKIDGVPEGAATPDPQPPGQVPPVPPAPIVIGKDVEPDKVNFVPPGNEVL
jgi:hypothetical protein